MFKKVVESEPGLTLYPSIKRCQCVHANVRRSGYLLCNTRFWELQSRSQSIPETLPRRCVFVMHMAAGNRISCCVHERLWAGMAQGVACVLGSRIDLWASNIRNVAVVVHSRVVFEDEGDTYCGTSRAKRRTRRFASRPGYGSTQTTRDRASQQKRVRVECTEI